MRKILDHRAVNEWNLVLLITVPMSIMVVVAMLGADLSTGPGVSSMIGFSVRFAVPFIYLVVAASSVYVLFPGPFTKWWMRNQKYFGMCFAAAMAWQGLFIFIMSNFHRDYYFEEVFLLRDELEGTTGYIFLAAMLVTSFHIGRKYVNPKQWKHIHKCGIYFLWAYPFAVYWWNLFYYENPLPIDYVFYWSGFLAFALRIAAWAKKRRKSEEMNLPRSGTPFAFKALGGVVIAFGIMVAATGLHWREPVTAFLTAPKWSADLVLWLPFWPFRPFLSLFIIGLGAMLATTVPTQGAQQSLASSGRPGPVAE